MYIKKRFGIISSKDMTKEIQDTIQNGEKQYKELYEKIEELEKIIKEKNIEINLLNEQNKIYKDIIQNNNIKMENFILDKTDNNKKDNNPKILNFDKMQVLNKENGNNNINTDSIKSDFKINFNVPNITNINIKETHEHKDLSNKFNEKEEIKILKEENIDKSTVSIDSKNNNISYVGEISRNTKKQYDRSKPILTRFPIIPINITKEESMCDPTVKEILDFIASETNYLIKYQHRIGKYLDEIKKIDIEYIINFKVKKENLSYNQKSKLKKKIQRCKYLCDTYKYKLNSISFSIYNISIMSKKEWEEWLTELDKIIKDKYPSGYLCDYIKKTGKNKGQPCGIKDCEEH